MHKLYTIGYQSLEPEHLEQWVCQLGALLLDVRLSPRSRRATWSQHALSEWFGERYWHLDLLGNVNYKSGRPIQLKDEQAGLTVLKELLEDQPVILLCGCRNVQECHRRVIAERMAEGFGVEVEHLRGRFAPQQQQLGI